MSQKVITPVGSSLFVNFEKKQPNVISTWYKLLEKSDQEQFDRSLAERWETHATHRNKIAKRIRAWAKPDVQQKASAEITSILKIVQEKKTDLTVYLLASETIVSRLAAEILKEVLDGYQNPDGHTVTICFDPAQDVIPGLQVTDAEKFRTTGLHKLVTRIDAIADKKHKEVILNITGGFKAITPYLTMMGQVYNIPQCYIFEETNHLITFPMLPVQFDWGFAERYYLYLRDMPLLKSQPDILEEMKTYHLIDTSSSGKPFPTILGKLYYDFIERNLPTAKSIFGHIIEYKLFEYYSTYCYRNNPAYKPVRRGVDWEPPDPIEVDILLGDSEEDVQDFIIVESKSHSLIKKQAHIISRIQRHVDKFCDTGKIPCEYHLCIHYQSPLQVKEHHKNALKSNLTALQALFGVIPACTFKVFFLYVDFNVEAGRPSYQQFIARSIDHSVIEEYQL